MRSRREFGVRTYLRSVSRMIYEPSVLAGISAGMEPESRAPARGRKESPRGKPGVAVYVNNGVGMLCIYINK